MQNYKIEFEDGEGNGEMYNVGIRSVFIYLDGDIIASYKKNYKDAINPFYAVRLKDEDVDLPTKCYSLHTVAETALTAYLLKGGILSPVKDESKTTAYALLISWGDGSKSYLNEGDSLYTIYIDNKAVRLFRTREEADFAGKIQKLRNPHTQVETVSITI